MLGVGVHCVLGVGVHCVLVGVYCVLGVGVHCVLGVGVHCVLAVGVYCVLAVGSSWRQNESRISQQQTGASRPPPLQLQVFVYLPNKLKADSTDCQNQQPLPAPDSVFLCIGTPYVTVQQPEVDVGASGAACRSDCKSCSSLCDRRYTAGSGRSARVVLRGDWRIGEHCGTVSLAVRTASLAVALVACRSDARGKNVYLAHSSSQVVDDGLKTSTFTLRR